MRVRRVRLLDSAAGATSYPVSLPSPGVRRASARLDRVRVRSVSLRAEETELRTRWGWTPDPYSQATPTKPPRKAGPQPAETAPDDFLTGLRELLRPNVRAILSREEWVHPLYPFQEEGVLFLYERQSALLADEMGLGKTIQALAALGLLLSTNQISQAVVLCPAPLVLNWTREAHSWLPRLEGGIVPVTGSPLRRVHLWRSRAPLLIAGYESFRADFEADRLPERTWDLLILDEAQRIKNEDTALSRACKTLPRKRSWALTGTPLENRLDELESILEFACGKPLGSGVGASSLRSAQQALQLRRTKEGVALDLPPKSVVTVYLELAGQQRRTYDRLAEEGILELRERRETLTITHVLSLLARLKQLCNFCSVTGESVKLEFLSAQLAEIRAADRQALVFSQFVDERFGIGRLGAEIEGMELYSGRMSQAARDEVVRRFQQREIDVLGISLRAGGVGLNLQRASYVFHFDRWWNPALEWQAEDRAHRLGQELPVTVYRLVTVGTIEERIHDLLAAKEKLFAQVVDGAPQPDFSGLSMDELLRLLDLQSLASL